MSMNRPSIENADFKGMCVIGRFAIADCLSPFFGGSANNLPTPPQNRVTDIYFYFYNNNSSPEFYLGTILEWVDNTVLDGESDDDADHPALVALGDGAAKLGTAGILKFSDLSGSAVTCADTDYPVFCFHVTQ